MHFINKAALVSLALLGAIQTAHADTIDFLQFNGTDGTTLSGVTADGVSFTATASDSADLIGLQQSSSWGGAFSDNAGVLFNTGTGTLTLDFASDISSLTSFAIQSNYYGDYTASISLYEGSTLLGTETLSGYSNYAPGTATTFDLSGYGAFNEVVISTTNNGAGFGVATQAVSAVPEPASWALLIAGISLTGMMLRRRSSQAQTPLAA